MPRSVRGIELFMNVCCMYFLYVAGSFYFRIVLLLELYSQNHSLMVQFYVVYIARMHFKSHNKETHNHKYIAINMIMQFADAKGWKSIALDTEMGFFLMFAFAISLAFQHFHLLLRTTTFPFFVTNTDRGKEISQTALMGWLCKAMVFGDSLLVVHIQYLHCIHHGSSF